MNLAYNINYCAKLLKNELNQALESEALTVAQFAVLKDIEKHSNQQGAEQGVMAVQIAQRLEMDKPTVSGVIQRLVAKNYLEKITNPADQRSFLLYLTPTAQAMLPRLEEIHTAVLAEMTQGLTTQEIKQFNEIIAKIIENME